MCGITGYFAFRDGGRISRETLLAMTVTLEHRGPDDTGCALLDPSTRRAAPFKSLKDEIPFDSASAAFGQRRLSILDLSSLGHQPMSSPDGMVWLTLNGEIYNYVELREELKAKGHRFISSTDTEVALHSFMEWGLECFSRFNGMWALAFCDLRTGKLVLSRDRYGKKPLYFHHDGKRIVFASEIKALFQCPEVPKRPNPRKVLNYAGRHYRYVDCDEESFFEGICNVPRGSWIEYSSDRSSRSARYWELKTDETLANVCERELIERFRALLEDAVMLRLRSDVPVGAMLSGGMDSTSVTCLAAAHNPRFKTFSNVTGTGYYDETEYINETIRQTGVNSQFIYPKPAELTETLTEMLGFHDEPVCTVTWFSMYLTMREIANSGITVILTGHGGDELLAGYWDHYHYNFHDIRSSGGDDSHERQCWLDKHHRNPAEYDRERAYIESLLKDRRIEIDKYSRYLDTLSPALLRHDKLSLPEPCLRGELSRRLFLEAFYETIPASLRAEDRNCMAFSIENRVPFLDYRLAEFCFSLPNRYKIRDGVTKWILRESMKGIMPEKVRTRLDKTGHNAPFDEWIRNENRAEFESLLAEKSFVNTEFYDHAKLRKRFAAHLGGENHYMFFWHYLNLSLWHKHFFGEP